MTRNRMPRPLHATLLMVAAGASAILTSCSSFRPVAFDTPATGTGPATTPGVSAGESLGLCTGRIRPHTAGTTSLQVTTTTSVTTWDAENEGEQP